MAFAERVHRICSRLRVTLVATLALMGVSAAAPARACPETGGDVGDAEARLSVAAADAAAKRWPEAAKGFRAVALGHAGSDEGRSAVRR